MVQDIERSRPQSSLGDVDAGVDASVQLNGQFPASAPAANPVFYRTYSRKLSETRRESWAEVTTRTLQGLVELGRFTPEETAIVDRMQQQLKCLPSGRWLWVGGTEWIRRQENFSGAYNCTSTNVIDWPAFGLMMDLAMMGCGTGAILEPKYTDRLPAIRNRLTVKLGWGIGTVSADERQQKTVITLNGNQVTIVVGDSRRGWVDSYQGLLELSTDDRFTGDVEVTIDLGNVRPAGEKLKGFGGVANPIKLPSLYDRCAQILNKAIGRQLTPVECCLLIDEAAACVVAGNIRRCLPEDALVHTDRGLIPIKDIQIGDRVQTPLGFQRVVDKFDQGMQDVYEIQTNATTPRATLNHRQAVLASATGEIVWKSVASLEPGDRLMHSTQILSGSVTHLPADFTSDRPEQSRTAKPITIPVLTADVAWLIGLTHGDGYVALGTNKHGKPYGRVEWAMNGLEPEQSAAIQAKLDRALAQFGLTATHGKVNGENTLKSVCSSIRLAEYFHAFIKQPNVTLTVPSFILQGSIDVRSAYLAGLMDSDGSAQGRPPHLLTSVYRSFVRQVGAVLSSLGIAGRMKLVHPKNETWQVKYTLTLPAFKSQYNALIAPHSIKGAIHQGLKMYGFTVPGKVMREVYSYSEMREMGFQGNRSVDANYERYVAEADVNLDIPVTVKGLGSYDHVQTYDIEVEEAHCFYCDGYLTHNSAGMRQGNSEDHAFAMAKDNLWQQGEDGNWRIDPERDALRMANHTRVYHRKPTKQEVEDAVRKQFYSGEGAIQYAPEAIARSNADLLPTREQQLKFITAYESDQGAAFLLKLAPNMPQDELEHRLGRYGLNPCGEILGEDFHCNLAEVHLNQIDPHNLQEQEDAFTAGALTVAALLHHKFTEPRYRRSRELDPIVGVSFTGLFDFFVNAFGTEWLNWWAEGRPDTVKGLEFKAKEQEYLSRWKAIVHRVVGEYCDRHVLHRPNRCTTVQPAGTKSLLTGASSGWHPPKAQRFIRRITFRKNDPVALACLDYGYNIVPSQSDKDDEGNLLNDPFDPRCTEWLVEIPVEVPWANIPGADEVAIEQFSATAQFDFYMQVQKYYTAHNTSATIELREDEIDALSNAIYNAVETNDGYMSAALLARFDAPFPRLPFEKIDRATYLQLSADVIARRKTDNFYAALAKYDSGEVVAEGPAGCDSDKCMMPEKKG
ncbi:ribonucleoside-triphosphate reductase, adenosylcobalamin-dependent [Alkalinema pantanalense CENA528]|uniref:ribonucleoside-triphosphate reductase, adenosylcobalamin-dependent n=1 Tax=Alkalinema pantanalense TaxID=1620705 RepID=UPI003D6E39C8